MKKIIIICLLAFTLSSCEDLFTPAKENLYTLDQMYTNPGYAYGILITAYASLPFSSDTDVATDDAVSNDNGNGYRNMALGQWSAINNPVERWRTGRSTIQAINLFLENVEKVEWSKKEDLNQYFIDRMTGEAYALRGLQMLHLLKAHAGWTADGQLLGIPIVLESENVSSDFNLPRNTFEECINQVFADYEKALEFLPTEYVAHTAIPDKYTAKGFDNIDSYNRVFGSNFVGLIDGNIVEAFQAQASLFAASPAWDGGSPITYKDAAEYAAKVIEKNGGVRGIDAKGNTWYCNKAEIEGLSNGAKPKEMVWRRNIGQGLDKEKAFFPPTLYGQGRINPTQNLVDAFPMKNGYPITDAASGYNESDPYAERDPRLSHYIVYNGSTQGHEGKVITTASDGATLDALNRENGKSTRTGYYMRKLTRSYINANPASQTPGKFYDAIIRYTEIYLNYAEAANEAYGPTGSAGSYSESAYDVVKAIRIRAGIDPLDPYLESIKGDKAKMRELIRNERRLELCFEGFRFWDVRRWKVSPEQLSMPAYGINISASGNSVMEVEKREYQSFMYYGPIPDSEIIKFSNLVQNKDW